MSIEDPHPPDVGEVRNGMRWTGSDWEPDGQRNRADLAEWRRLLLIAVVIVAIGLAVLWILVSMDDDEPDPVPSPSPTVVVTPTLTQ